MHFEQKNHEQLVRDLIRYAGVKDVSEPAQKYLFESALEYLAVVRLMPEAKISHWPKNGLVGGFQALVDEAVG